MKKPKHAAARQRTPGLRERLKAGAIANAERDLAMAAEWFPLEEEAWELAEASRKKPAKARKKTGSGREA